MVAIRRFIWPEYITIVLKLIAHDGVFNTQSMFGTTEEVFQQLGFGGPYWEKDNAIAQNLYHIQPY
jgi:hypothetical protein